MTTIGYTRISQESDTSIDRQKRHIEEYAIDQNLSLETIYDDGERSSGFDENREEYQIVRDRVQSGELTAVIVNDKRRLARDFDETMRLVLDLREYNVEAHTHQSGQLDLSDPVQAAVEVLQAASEHEAKKKEIERAIEAVKERIEQGYYQGRPPAGLTFDENGEYLVPDKDQWEDIVRVFGLRDRGESYRDIADKTAFSKSTVGEIIERGEAFYEEYGNTDL